jgi:hypothetical protein
MSKGSYHNRSHKFIAAEKPNRRVMISAVKVNLHKLCDCPNSEPGKVSTDTGAHEPGCHIQKRLQTGRYTVNTSVTPRRLNDGYGLGIVLGEENY